MDAHKYLTGCSREQQAQQHAKEPRGKKGTEDIKRRGTAAARQNQWKERQAQVSKSLAHG
jgi:hypothetical protein